MSGTRSEILFLDGARWVTSFDDNSRAITVEIHEGAECRKYQLTPKQAGLLASHLSCTRTYSVS